MYLNHIVRRFALQSILKMVKRCVSSFSFFFSYFNFQPLFCLEAWVDDPTQKVSSLASSILPKNEFENLNFCPSLLGQKFFVCFLEELKEPKCPFEIIWPLITVKSTVEIWQNFVAFSEYMKFNVTRRGLYIDPHSSCPRT